MTYKKITEIIPNPDNPRVIKDNQFKKLVASISEFPEMLEVRPIVVNKDMVILGGNMRYRACVEAGLKEVPVAIAEWDEKHDQEFVIKDNTNMGEWDWDVLANEWELDNLDDWGVELPRLGNIDELEKINEMDEWVGMPEFESVDSPPKLIIQFESEREREEFVNKIDLKIAKKNKNNWGTWYPYKERENLKDKKYE